MALSAIARRILANFMMSRPEAEEICDAIDNVAVGNATNGNIGNTLTFAANANMVFNATNGTMIGTNANQKFALWGGTPIARPAVTGILIGMNGNAATNANAVNMNSNGNIGSTYMNFDDVVFTLKSMGAAPP